MGVDGPQFRPGNTWGHVETAGTHLTAGEHEFEALGFEDCCDGHAELEVHLPCDRVESAWRIVAHGDTPCLSCALADPTTEGPVIDGQQRSCASENDAAACCRQQGNGCSSVGGSGGNAIRGDWCGGIGGGMTCGACDDPSVPPTSAHVGRFVAVGTTMSMYNALDYCESHYQGLASIHSWEEAQQAKSACLAYADASETVTSSSGNNLYGCWIGFQDTGAEGGFVWLDGSSVSYVDWAPGKSATSYKTVHASAANAKGFPSQASRTTSARVVKMPSKSTFVSACSAPGSGTTRPRPRTTRCSPCAKPTFHNPYKARR